jgi:hypothetical protein
MKDHNITMPLDEIHGEISIVDFLKKYQKYADRK